MTICSESFLEIDSGVRACEKIRRKICLSQIGLLDSCLNNFVQRLQFCLLTFIPDFLFSWENEMQKVTGKRSFISCV